MKHGTQINWISPTRTNEKQGSQWHNSSCWWNTFFIWPEGVRWSKTCESFYCHIKLVFDLIVSEAFQLFFNLYFLLLWVESRKQSNHSRLYLHKRDQNRVSLSVENWEWGWKIYFPNSVAKFLNCKKHIRNTNHKTITNLLYKKPRSGQSFAHSTEWVCVSGLRNGRLVAWWLACLLDWFAVLACCWLIDFTCYFIRSIYLFFLNLLLFFFSNLLFLFIRFPDLFIILILIFILFLKFKYY